MRTFILLLLLILISGLLTSSNSFQSQKFFTINYEGLLRERQTIGLDQIAQDVKYIKLETNSDCVIDAGARYLFTDSLIFVNNRNHVLEFSRTGKFLKKIGSTGRGPEEILRIIEMSLIPATGTVVTFYKKLSYFSFNGKFIKTVITGPDFRVKVMEDGRYIAYNLVHKGDEEYVFRLTNEHNDTISIVKNHFKWLNKTGASFGFVADYFHPFYNYKNRTYLKDIYNDTVFVVNKNKIEPYCFVDMGKYKLPDELRPEYLVPLGKGQLYRDNREKYYYCDVLEAADNIFLESLNYQKNIRNFFLFNKKTGSGFLLADKKGKSAGFINNYDGGPDFWPYGNVNDNQLYMPVNMTTLKNSLEKIKNNKPTKFPEKHDQLFKTISESDLADNPVLMIVTLK